MKREYCEKCLRPIVTCYCHQIKHYNIDSQIIILQHPTETKHPLNSAKIAELSIDQCSIIIGEDFSGHFELNNILNNNQCALVFPSDENVIGTANFKKFDKFIFIDGTWRKAKKILYMNKTLANLPRLTIDTNLKSKYTIRKVPKDGYLSTLEAICFTIQQSENKDIFDTVKTLEFIQEKQIEKMGLDTFNKNYN